MLNEGSTYTVVATVTNGSTVDGVPAAATLDIGWRIAGDVVYLPDTYIPTNFGAGETKQVTCYQFTIPIGQGGKNFTVFAKVYPPGNRTSPLAAASKAFFVESPVGTLTLSDIQIIPSPTLVDTPVSVIVVGVADITGTYTVNLKVNGVQTQTQNVPLNAGEAKYIYFTYSATTIGTYTIQVGNLTGQLEVIAPLPLSWRLAVAFWPKNVKPNQPVTIYATVLNDSTSLGSTGNIRVQLDIGTLTEAQTLGPISPGQGADVIFNIALPNLGTYPFTITAGDKIYSDTILVTTTGGWPGTGLSIVGPSEVSINSIVRYQAIGTLGETNPRYTGALAVNGTVVSTSGTRQQEGFSNGWVMDFAWIPPAKGTYHLQIEQYKWDLVVSDVPSINSPIVLKRFAFANVGVIYPNPSQPSQAQLQFDLDLNFITTGRHGDSFTYGSATNNDTGRVKANFARTAIPLPNFDVNGDGFVNMGDVTKIERMILHLDTPDLQFDFNGNGMVDTGDETLLERRIFNGYNDTVRVTFSTPAFSEYGEPVAPGTTYVTVQITIELWNEAGNLFHLYEFALPLQVIR